MLDAISGLIVMLSAQFYTFDFSFSAVSLTCENNGDMEPAIGQYFKIKFPDWPYDERYDFDWQKLKLEDSPIQLVFNEN